VFFNDTFTEYMHPEVGMAATRVLEALGYRVLLVSQKECCGRPLISKGQLAKAKEWARTNVAALAPYAERGVVIVGTEPSCLLTLRDEYPDLLRDEPSRAVAGQALMLDELIARIAADEPEAVKGIFSGGMKPSIQVHGHCHQKAIVGTGPTMEALALAGFNAELIDSACCGMAGTFGFEAEHYEMSKAMGALKLFPAIEAEGRNGWPVAISGISCRQQIDHFTSKRPRHVAEFLADALA
ncbi:MAG: FAD-binding oxidoreductase, partial [Chloroflexi bacterium]|nr:FAD-binding oxidoreductase [Chloroflexota bacterium]